MTELVSRTVKTACSQGSLISHLLAPKGALEMQMSVCPSVCAAHYALNLQRTPIEPPKEPPKKPHIIIPFEAKAVGVLVMGTWLVHMIQKKD